MTGFSLDTSVSLTIPVKKHTVVSYTYDEALPLYLQFIKQMAKRYSRFHPELQDDFEQEGLITLWKVCAKYDSSHGVPFEHYARRSIKNSIISQCRGLSEDEVIFQYREESDENNEDTDKSLACPDNSVFSAYQDLTEPENQILQAQLERSITEVVQTFTVRQQLVFEKIYREGMSVSELASSLGISHQAISKQYKLIEKLVHDYVCKKMH